MPRFDAKKNGVRGPSEDLKNQMGHASTRDIEPRIAFPTPGTFEGKAVSARDRLVYKYGGDKASCWGFLCIG